MNSDYLGDLWKYTTEIGDPTLLITTHSMSSSSGTLSTSSNGLSESVIAVIVVVVIMGACITIGIGTAILLRRMKARATSKKVNKNFGK
jgi:hypothetical protein